MLLMGSHESDNTSEQESASVIAEVLAEKFGLDAIYVAEHQLAAASPDSQDMWNAIVSRLSP